MLSCEQVIQEIWVYLDQDLKGQELVHVKQHLELCRACFSRCEFERMLRDNCKTKTNHACPDAVKDRIRKILEQY